MMEYLLNLKLLGALIGLVIGIVAITLGAWEAFVLALFILGGWFIGKFLIGEIDLIEPYQRFLDSRGAKRV